MPTDDAATEVPPPPAASALLDLPADVWASLLPSIRAALHDVDEAAASPVLRRLRSAPTGRLAGGRVRRDLCTLLADDGPAWRALHRRLVDEGLLDTWTRALTTAPPPAPPAPAPAPPPPATDRRALERARERLREARDERDALRRRLDAAEVRAKRAEEAAATAEAALADARTRLAAAQEELTAAEAAREAAVARERRRGESAQARLREELAALRRADEERRAERRRADERRRAQVAEARDSQRRRERQRRDRPPRVVPGRPSRLPEGVRSGTAEAVALLLHPGRLVLVDGYNLTRQHRDHLDLETQRAWLVQLLATAALQRRIRPVAIFDGERASRARPALASREVEVRFTPEGVTADDELVLSVEGTDEPVLVVTDDRELQARVRMSGADVAGTREFLWALG
ncbi:NYN domain-containing protein [Egicoccus sp. AB-alg2]|uniref:NYN domain-containing protein n=1 Tax=Egicoccus sp. AB-alg2 TaxID=3242693 RepID=UPI00359CD20F